MLLILLGCLGLRREAVSPLDGALSVDSDCARWEDPALARALDRQTNSVERPGNHAELLVDGVRAFERRWAISEAADVLLVKTFIFADDETGRGTVELLKRRAEAGAVVVLQVDLKGSVSGVEDALAALEGDLPQLEGLREAGVLVVYTNVPGEQDELARWVTDRDEPTEWDGPRRRGLWNFDHFDHEKSWIAGTVNADGELIYEAIVGGMNVASEYAYGGTERVDAGTGRGGWHDVDVALRGPVVNDIVARFWELALLNGGPLPLDPEELNPPQPQAGPVAARFVWNQPALIRERRIEQAFRTHLAHMGEGQVARVEMAYFAPSPRLMRSLRASLRRGRRLAVVTNSAHSVDVPLVADASRAAYTSLLRTSPTAALYEWEPEPGRHTLHAKVASFGVCGPVMIGSANLDGLSSEHNSEAVVFLRDPSLRAAFDAMFERDMEQGQRITVGDVERSGMWARLRARGVYRVGWYWLSG